MKLSLTSFLLLFTACQVKRLTLLRVSSKMREGGGGDGGGGGELNR